MEIRISTFAAATILNIEYYRLNEWLRGYFTPTFSRAKGRGTRTVFSVDDLFRLGVMGQLTARGISRELARDVCEELRKKLQAGENPFGKGYIVVGTCMITGVNDIIYLQDEPDEWVRVLLHLPPVSKALGVFSSNVVVNLAAIKRMIGDRMNISE